MGIKLLIVDDEPVICEGLKQTVPWDELDVEVAGEAYDGREALEHLERQPVDLVLTDVRMPGMDGLELAREIRSRYPDISIVMISGYEDFEYARQGLRIGVKDYLLKPVEVEELMALVRKIGRDVLAARREKRLRREQTLKEALNRVVSGTASHSGAWLFPGFREERFWLVATRKKEYARRVLMHDAMEQSRIIRQWCENVEDVFNRQALFCVSVFAAENCLLTCCTEEPGKPLDERSMHGMAHILAERDYDLLTAFYERPVRAEEIPEAWSELAETTKMFPLLDARVLVSPRCRPSAAPLPVTPESVVSEWRSLLMDKRFSVLEDRVKSLLERCRSAGVTLDDAVKLLEQIASGLTAMFPDPPALRLRQGIDAGLYNSYRLVEEVLMADLLVLQERIASPEDERHWLVERAVQYIREHYRQDLKAAGVAGRLHISPNYFSQLFKQRTGKHFNEYLNEIRLEEARRLLGETNRKVFEIAECVGYRDYKYFVHLFKKASGMTPTEFRSRLANSSCK